MNKTLYLFWITFDALLLVIIIIIYKNKKEKYSLQILNFLFKHLSENERKALIYLSTIPGNTEKIIRMACGELELNEIKYNLSNELILNN